MCFVYLVIVRVAVIPSATDSGLNKRENNNKWKGRTDYNRPAYPSNIVSPAPGGIPDSGGLMFETEQKHDTSALTLKSSIGLRVTRARQVRHVYLGLGDRDRSTYALPHSWGNS